MMAAPVAACAGYHYMVDRVLHGISVTATTAAAWAS